ncbi:hypothetical protein XA68_12488 [Ophiocordyceps unilateralis]|uniref:Galactose oxidase n=1 Tax=Ophiocordyceps unilateralis TaxID=268505 RepID=A0A2A9PET3_OPHUN|nr:hypothetical protein XA68_12488 [Ophiocordyceps unilateralis]
MDPATVRILALFSTLVVSAEAKPPYAPTQVLSTASVCTDATSVCRGRDVALILTSSSQLVAFDYGSGDEFEAGSKLRVVSSEVPFQRARAFGAARAADGELLVVAGDCRRLGSAPQVWSFDAADEERGWVRKITSGGEADFGPPLLLGATLAFSSTLAPVMDRPSIYSYGGMCSDDDDEGEGQDWQASGNYSKTMRRFTPDGEEGYIVGTAAASAPRTALAGFSLTALPPSATNISGTVTQRASYVLLGGHTRSAFINMSTAAVWSLPEEAWTYVGISTASPSSTAPDSRSGHTAVLSADGRDVVVLGGWVGDVNTAAMPQMVVLRRGGNGAYSEWRWIVPESQPDAADGVFGHGAALVPGNVMLVYGGRRVGGGGGGGGLGEEEMGLRFLNLSSMEWLSSYRHVSDAGPRHRARPSAPELTGSAPNVRRLGLGLGLGLGLALLLALILGLCAWLLHRRRRRRQRRQRRRNLDNSVTTSNNAKRIFDTAWRRNTDPSAYTSLPIRKPLPATAAETTTRFDAFVSPPGVIHPILEEVDEEDHHHSLLTPDEDSLEDPFATPSVGLERPLTRTRLDPEVREWVTDVDATDGLLSRYGQHQQQQQHHLHHHHHHQHQQHQLQRQTRASPPRRRDGSSSPEPPRSGSLLTAAALLSTGGEVENSNNNNNNSPSSSSYNTARSGGFPALQAEAPGLLLGPRSSSSDDYSPSASPTKPRSPPRRSWFGSLRRVFSVSGTESSSPSPAPLTRPSLDRAASDMDRPLGGVGELLRRRQGRLDWDDEDEERAQTGEWDIERAAEQRLVQVMFTVPRERLRVVNGGEDDDEGGEETLLHRPQVAELIDPDRASPEPEVDLPPPQRGAAASSSRASSWRLSTAAVLTAEAVTLERPRTRVLQMVDTIESRGSSPARQPDLSRGASGKGEGRNSGLWSRDEAQHDSLVHQDELMVRETNPEEEDGDEPMIRNSSLERQNQLQQDTSTEPQQSSRHRNEPHLRTSSPAGQDEPQPQSSTHQQHQQRHEPE